MFVAWVCLATLATVVGTGEGAPVLGRDGSRFTLDGRPTFLLGCSYYAGTGAPDAFVVADFDELAAAGFNWVRVWATWTLFGDDISAVDQTGAAREPHLGRLKRLIELAGERGMVVDVTLAHAQERAGQKPILTSYEAHERAAVTLARELRAYRNVYFDLSNERSLKNKFVSYEELGRMAAAVRAVDPDRLLTASDTGEIDEGKVVGYLRTATLDFLTPHRPRNSASARANGEKTRELLGLLDRLGLVAPVHDQEPFRRGFSQGWEPTVEDFWADLTGAVDGGAAGWCLHNGDQRLNPDGQRPRRSFDLREGEGRLFDQLDEVEREVIARCRERWVRRQTG